MAFTWRNAEARVLNPEADFRVNTVVRSIAHDLQTDPDEIWWLVVITPAPGVSIETLLANASGELELGDDPTAYMAVPGEYSSGERTADDPGLVSFYARRHYINAANEMWQKAGVAWLEVGSAFRPDDIRFQPDPFSFLPDKISVPSGSCVVAVIDSGMAVGHDLFRTTDADGKPVSRVEFFWNMDGTPHDPANLPENAEPTSYGNAWTAKGLSRNLDSNMHDGLLDDAAFYADICATDWSRRQHTPIAHRLSHGTHVMGLCAGLPANESPPVGIDKRPIIAVNLNSRDVADPSGELFAIWLEQALRYIRRRHKRFVMDDGSKPPLVINFSFGNYAGPHDGTGAIEGYIKKAMKKLPGAQFVLPSGNGNLSRCHALVELLPADPSATLDWRLQPQDRSPSSVQLWLKEIGPVPSDYLTLTVEGPGGVPPVTLNCATGQSHSEISDQNGHQIGYADFIASSEGPYERGHFRVSLYETANYADVGPFTPAGLWWLRLASGAVEAVVVDAWIVRDETLPGFPEYGRQSYFDNASYTRFYAPGVAASHLDPHLIGARLGYDPDSPVSIVKRSGTISGFAASKGTVVIGGYVEADEERNSDMALYSATGPTRSLDTTKWWPDASACSDDSPVLSGVFSAGSASGSIVAMPGTSVAAPQVTRFIAGRLSQSLASGPAEVKAEADAMDPNAANPRKPPQDRSGKGRMLDLTNLYGALRKPKVP